MGARTMMLLVSACAGSALAGPDWVEIPDAGRITPQVIPLVDQPESIVGELSGMDFDGGPDIADSYRLKIDTPGTFVATLSPVVLRPAPADKQSGANDPSVEANTNFDGALWLFRTDRLGLLANRDAGQNQPLARLSGFSTDGTGVRIPGPGEYILAVSYNDVFPVSASGPIFNFDDQGGPFQVSGPDGGGASVPFNNWFIPPGTTRPPGMYTVSIITERPRQTIDCCPGDANGDRIINFADITTVLSRWGRPCP
ncbi:MAG: hypothetical protein SFZ24_09220 [Planctomycetota bacterium]|nr:hypothetical protein [Planctomycetota bacterium]